jgi:hypothetical protein
MKGKIFKPLSKKKVEKIEERNFLRKIHAKETTQQSSAAIQRDNLFLQNYF